MPKKINVAIFLLSLVPLGYILRGALPVNVELTLFIYIALYITGVYRMMIMKESFFLSKVDILLFICVLLVFIGSFYTPIQFNGIMKSLKFIFLSISLVFFCRLFIKDRKDVSLFFKYLIFSSVLTEYLVIVDFFASGASTFRYVAFGIVVPIPLSMLGATTSIILVMLYLYRKVNLTYFILGILPSISMMTLAASKGPVISLLVTILLLAPIFIKKIKVKFILVLTFALFFITRIGFINDSLNTLILRFSYADDDLSTSVRMGLYDEALMYFSESPIWGQGTGSLTVYPHNFFIEVLAENGLIFLLLILFMLALFVFSYMKFLMKKSPDVLEGLIIALFLISLTSLMFSFSYVDHKYFFLSVGLLIAYQRIIKTSAINVTDRSSENKTKPRKRLFKKVVW